MVRSTCTKRDNHERANLVKKLIEQLAGTYLVKSSDGSTNYFVNVIKRTCTCKHFQKTERFDCRHAKVALQCNGTKANQYDTAVAAIKKGKR